MIKEFITASKISNAAEKISVVLCIIGVNAALLSFILGGVSFLDAGALALIPAFLFFLWSLFSNWDNETKDYCLSLILIILCIIFALFHKYQFEVGATDDGYHNAKIVAYSIKNSFQTKFQYISPQEDERYFLVDSIESLWGIFWRWFHWDYIIVCLQAFPLLILWKILVTFFRQSHLKNSPALLAFLIVASMPILWCQQNSTYIDGTVGLVAAIVLLLSYQILTTPASRTFWPLLGLAFTASLLLTIKTHLLVLSFLGLTISLVAAVRHVHFKKIPWIILSAIPSLSYFLYHHYHVWKMKGHPFYPWWKADGTSIYKTMSEGMLHYVYKANPFYNWMKSTVGDFKPLYVLGSWLQDYRLDGGYMIVDPRPGGNGLLWTYLVVPLLVVIILKNIKNLWQPQKWLKSNFLIFALLVFYYYAFDGSINSRLMLGFHIFILAWTLRWLWQHLGNLPQKFLIIGRPVLIFLICIGSMITYLASIRGPELEPRIISVIRFQHKIFPRYMHPHDIHKMVYTMAEQKKEEGEL